VNPAHLDEAYAEKSMLHNIIGHGMRGGALVSAVLGTRLPGPGTIYLGQDLHFRKSSCSTAAASTRRARR
jgi:phosphate acetyltransferase